MDKQIKERPKDEGPKREDGTRLMRRERNNSKEKKEREREDDEDAGQGVAGLDTRAGGGVVEKDGR